MRRPTRVYSNIGPQLAAKWPAVSIMSDEDWRRYFGALAFEVVEEGAKGGGESGVEEGGGGERPGVESGPAWPEKGSKPPGPPALAEREEVGD